MNADLSTLLTTLGLGTVLGSVVTLLLKDHLARQEERRRQQIETDRATYQERITRLIGANLSALIRSNRCREGERAELADLVQELSEGAHRERFLDPTVQLAWLRLVELSSHHGWRRLTDSITDTDIAEYTRAWEVWMVASRESFGPLPEADPPPLRRMRAAASEKKAA